MIGMRAVGIIGGACVLAVLAADSVQADAAPDWPQMSADAVKALSQYEGGVGNVGRNVVWPGADENTFTADQIPEKIREGTARWIAKVLRENYVEANLSMHMIGVRRVSTPGREIDQIFVRYRKRDVVVQVCEHAVGMTVLISPAVPSSKGPEDWQGAQSYVALLFSRTFRQPSVSIRRASTTTLWSKQKDKTPIFYGTLSLDPNKEFDTKAPRYWFDDIRFLVDGDKVAFSFFKTDGEVQEETARPPAPSGKRW
jgi:hypothetical protein